MGLYPDVVFPGVCEMPVVRPTLIAFRSLAVVVCLALLTGCNGVDNNANPDTGTGGTVTVSSYTDSTVSNGTAYFYVVTAVNSAGESGDSTQASVTPDPAITTPAI